MPTRARPSDRRPGPWELGSFAVIALLVALQILHLQSGDRLLRDPGRFHLDLVSFYHQSASLTGLWDSLLSGLSASGGWYNAGLAAWLRLVGRSTDHLSIVTVLWLLGILTGAWALARRMGGPRAGFATLTLLAAIPTLIQQARSLWIHVPETAVLLWMVVLFSGDPTLSRRRTVLALGLMGAFLLNLRGTGVLWVSTLGLALLWTTRGRPVLRVGGVVALWSIGGIPALMRMDRYVGGKVAARDRYLANQPSFVEDLAAVFSVEALVLVGLGIAALLWHRRARLGVSGLLLASWIAVAFGVYAVLRAGLSNYLPFVPAAAILGAVGLVSRDRRLVWLPLVAAIPNLGAMTWLSLQGDTAEAGGSWLWNEEGRQPEHWGASQIAGLLDATCLSDAWHSCRVVVTEGLTHPTSEDFGTFSLFTLAEDRVELRTVYDEPPAGWVRHGVNALALFECGELSDHYYRRGPDARDRAARLMETLGMQEVYASTLSPDCSYHWFTPQGRLRHPERLPPVETPALPLSAARLRALSADFAQRNPDFTGGERRAPLYTREHPIEDEAPPGWSAEASRQERERLR